jgi:hypothetical protein
MPSLEDHFRALTRVRPPESWPDLDQHATRPLPRRGPPPRRVGLAALALIVAGAGLFAAARAFQRQVSTTGTNATPSAEETPSPTFSPVPPSPTRPAAEGEHGVFGAMLAAIRGSSPADWRFALQHDRLDGDWRFDGNVDDGSGPGRLYVDVTVRPGMLVAHPCADSEFRQGARCVEHPLGDGDLLVLRGVVLDAGGMKTIDVVLVHPDGSGTNAEAGNWTTAPLPSGAVSQSELPSPGVTRPDPLYTVDQLARLVQAVDEAVRSCIESSCK